MTYKINKKAKTNMIELYPTASVSWPFTRWYKDTAIVWTSKKTSGNDSVSYDANGLITLSPQYSYMIKFYGSIYWNWAANYGFDFMYEDNTKVEGENAAQTKAGIRTYDQQNTNEGSVLLLKKPTKKIKLVFTTTSNPSYNYVYLFNGININITEFCL